MNGRVLPIEGITFEDVQLVLRYSDLDPKDPKEAEKIDIGVQLTPKVRLERPAIASAMEFCESEMAIAMAKGGGIGVIHRNLKADRQAAEVALVKREQSGFIRDPFTLSPDNTVGEASKLMSEKNISGIPVAEKNRFLKGLITKKDIGKAEGNDSCRIAEVMTPLEHLLTGPTGTSRDEARRMMEEKPGGVVGHLPVVSGKGILRGLYTLKGVRMELNFPRACTDENGRFRVAAAVGVHDYARVEKLLEAGVDIIVVDSAHANSKKVLETTREILRQFRKFEVQLIVGNVVDADGTEAVLKAGAHAVKEGGGSGSICITGVVTGFSAPQITAILECSEVTRRYGSCLVADGGIGDFGKAIKALVAGASAVMCGQLLAGCNENARRSANKIINGRPHYPYRGMGSEGAMKEGGRDPYNGLPEGVEGYVPCTNSSATDVLDRLELALCRAMGYGGARRIKDLWRVKMRRVSPAGRRESRIHDITLDGEPPLYPLSGEERGAISR